MHMDLTLLHSCTFVSHVTELLCALDHSSNAFALAQVASQKHFHLTFFASLLKSSSEGSKDYVVEVQAPDRHTLGSKVWWGAGPSRSRLGQRSYVDGLQCGHGVAWSPPSWPR